MYKIQRQSGTTLFSVLISTTIGIILLACGLAYLLNISKYANKIQHKIDYINSILITKYYIKTDIHNTSQIAIIKSAHGFDSLVLDDATYTLRESIIPKTNHLHSYSLYRDDRQHQAIAIAEGIQNIQIKTQTVSAQHKAVFIFLEFKKFKALELVFVTKKTSTV